jgi:hypothetical protein
VCPGKGTRLSERRLAPGVGWLDRASVSTPTPSAEAGPRGGWARSLLVILLVLAGGVGTAAAPVAWWTRGLVSDRDRYVATVKPLASDPALQSIVSTAVTGQVTSALDARSVTALQLPNALLGLLSGQRTVQKILDQEIGKVVSHVVAGPDFATLWTSLNRTAQPDLAALLTGSGPKGQTLSLSGDDVLLNTAAIVTAVKAELVADGLSFAAQVPVGGHTVVVARISHVARLQTWIGRLDRSARWLPWASGACFGLALVVARRRGRALVAVGLAVVVAMGALTAARLQARSRIEHRTALDATHRRLLVDVYAVLTRPLLHPVDLVAATGAALVVLGLLASAVGAGTRRRRSVGRLGESG